MKFTEQFNIKLDAICILIYNKQWLSCFQNLPVELTNTYVLFISLGKQDHYYTTFFWNKVL